MHLCPELTKNAPQKLAGTSLVLIREDTLENVLKLWKDFGDI